MTDWQPPHDLTFVRLIDPPDDDANSEDDKVKEGRTRGMIGGCRRAVSPKAKVLRAEAMSAAVHAKETTAPSRCPNTSDVEDVRRLHRLKAQPIIDVADLAWLYGISINTAYRSVKSGEFPSRRFGDRFRILSEPIFAELYPGGLPPFEHVDE